MAPIATLISRRSGLHSRKVHSTRFSHSQSPKTASMSCPEKSCAMTWCAYRKHSVLVKLKMRRIVPSSRIEITILQEPENRLCRPGNENHTGANCLYERQCAIGCKPVCMAGTNQVTEPDQKRCFYRRSGLSLTGLDIPLITSCRGRRSRRRPHRPSPVKTFIIQLGMGAPTARDKSHYLLKDYRISEKC